MSFCLYSDFHLLYRAGDNRSELDTGLYHAFGWSHGQDLILMMDKRGLALKTGGVGRFD